MNRKNKKQQRTPKIASPPARPASNHPGSASNSRNTPSAASSKQSSTQSQSDVSPAAHSAKPGRATLEQQRAAHALTQIDGVKNEKLAGDYKSYAESLPATIVMNGLGQALATLLAAAKGKAGNEDAHRRLFDHLEDWLCDAKPAVGLQKPLINALVDCDQSTYCHAQAEALSYLVWLKKFAQAFLANDKSAAKGANDGR
jgi:CRISPR-associated protein Cmr5